MRKNGGIRHNLWMAFFGGMITIIVCILYAQPVFAHGLVYETKSMGDNKIRITLKWSNPKEAKGISIAYYHLENGKTLTIGYELNDKAQKTATLDFDLSGAITPIRVIIDKAGDLNWRPFSDIKGIEAEKYIRHLHDSGVIDAGTNDKFRPNDNITRAEYAEMLAKALKLSGTADNKAGITDIKNSSAKNDILLVVKKRLMSADKNKKFNPNSPMPLAQICVTISKAFTFKTARDGIYTKLRTDKYYSSAVKKMFDMGILNVNDKLYEKFDEEKNTSRANAAMMLSRALTTY